MCGELESLYADRHVLTRDVMRVMLHLPANLRSRSAPAQPRATSDELEYAPIQRSRLRPVLVTMPGHL